MSITSSSLNIDPNLMMNWNTMDNMFFDIGQMVSDITPNRANILL